MAISRPPGAANTSRTPRPSLEGQGRVPHGCDSVTAPVESTARSVPSLPSAASAPGGAMVFSREATRSNEATAPALSR
ncbi:MAG: hypothetical protein A3I79_01215 [Gemmatimonadetes bacterium RIFCSPLOWO2_02_FULL_71_11]|nr:MAG: hypothetical protein A3I79_01215 [Gemmatimonadetes bacterium RIFCSPLOWO2_02_FULL_71_11]